MTSKYWREKCQKERNRKIPNLTLMLAIDRFIDKIQLTMKINDLFRFAQSVISDAFIRTKIASIFRSNDQFHNYSVDIFNGHRFINATFKENLFISNKIQAFAPK